MKIAIIGGGISGLAAAYYLHDRHQLTLFEAGDYLGGHTQTVTVEDQGRELAVDTGFIVFNERTYPNFIRLLGQLQVASQPSDMSFSVRCDRSGLEYSGGSLNGLFAQRRNLLRPRFHRLLLDFLRFSRQADDLLAADDSLTVGEFFARERYSPEFIEQYFLPMGSAVWSCPRDVFARFPIRFIVQFYDNHGLLAVSGRPRWRVITGGSATYVAALRHRFSSAVRLRCPVAAVVRRADHVEVRLSGGASERFDHIVFACHADQALAILGSDATLAEREVLSAFPYESNIATLHTDMSVLPRQRRAWASWNYHLPSEPAAKATLTYNMSRLQSLPGPRVYCVTLNGEAEIDPRKVIGTYRYAHPVFTTQRAAAQRRHGELLNRNRSSFCGAYWGNGFHEDGVNSALAVCAGLEKEPCKAVSTQEPCSTVATALSSTRSVIESI